MGLILLFMGNKKKIDDKILEVIPELVISAGFETIDSAIDDFLEEDEPFAEEKAAERKASKEKKKTTKEFGEW